MPLPISMHTGQIIMLTKMMTSADLRFYDFEAGRQFTAGDKYPR